MNFKERKSNNRFDVLRRNTEDISFKTKKNKEISSSKRQNKKKQYDNYEYLIDKSNNKFNYKEENTFKVKKSKQKININLNIDNEENFPTLGNLKNNTSKRKEQENNKITYLEIATQEKKSEIIIDPKSVEPGWIKLWKENGVIHSRYGIATKWRNDEYLRDQEYFNRLTKEIIKQMQQERDEITNLLGDRSPYYNTPSLLEYLEEEEEDYVKINESNSDTDDNEN